MAVLKPPEDLLATMTDPRGRTVWLTEERWKHILEGHPEVERYLPGLKQCVETAESRTKGNREGVEKLWVRNIGPTKWFCVVVRYIGRTGSILTAMPVKAGPQERDLI